MIRKNIMTLLFILAAIAFVYFLISLDRSIDTSSERNKQDWLEYKARCEEFGGLPNKGFTGFECQLLNN